MEMTPDQQAAALGFEPEIGFQFCYRKDHGAKRVYLTWRTEDSSWLAWVDFCLKEDYVAATAAAAYMLGVLNEWK